MRVQGTAIGMGSITPGPRVSGGRTGWRWRGKPPGWPYDPATHDPVTRPATTSDGERRAEAKRQKMRAFAAGLADGLSVPAASRRAGVDPKTGYGYLREIEAERAASRRGAAS